MKVNKFFLSLFSVCLSLLVIICLQGCEKDATTQSNNINSSTDSVVSSISLQDRYLDLDGDKKNDFWFTHSAVTTNSYPPSAIYFSLYVVCFDSNQVQNTLSAGSIPLQDSVQISDTSG